MDLNRKYEIAFVGLKEGIHRYTFEVDDGFFTLFENSLLKKGTLKITVDFDKKPSFFMLQFHIHGTVQVACDRCNASLNYPVKSAFPMIIKFADYENLKNQTADADVMFINRNDSHIQLSQLIYEFISLSIPLNHVTCDDLKGEKPCNEDVLKKLEAFEESVAQPDRRWTELSKFKFN